MSRTARSDDKPDPRAPAIPPPKNPSGSAEPDYDPANMPVAIPTAPVASDSGARPAFAPSTEDPPIAPREPGGDDTAAGPFPLTEEGT